MLGTDTLARKDNTHIRKLIKGNISNGVTTLLPKYFKTRLRIMSIQIY